jgi:orotidine-5'-phosphate decarboxylase
MREERIFATVEATKSFATTYKIGLSLFVGRGPKIIRDLQSLGADVFLDLKLHDIPMQVHRAVESALAYAPRFLTVHAQGGAAMLKVAARAAKGTNTKILAVTMLTSLGQADMADLGISSSVGDQVRRLADLALSSGIDGLVASPQELTLLCDHVGKSAYLVCPGIRGADDQAHDQARTLSAYEAIRQGANALVVGRPITQAENSLLRAKGIHAEIERGMRDTELML